MQIPKSKFISHINIQKKTKKVKDELKDNLDKKIGNINNNMIKVKDDLGKKLGDITEEVIMMMIKYG